MYISYHIFVIHIMIKNYKHALRTVLCKLFFFTHTTVTIQNLYMYQYYDTKHVCIPLGPVNIKAHFQDTRLTGCFPGDNLNFVVPTFPI
jgi:hypothetical protein